ncbi:MAG TPA: serine/threonine-protein kinase [Polyangia bacterium]|nr:serine/threonine-protein kinase [Polyangia bacterium]
MGSLSHQRGQGGSWTGGILLGNTYLLGQRINLGGMGEVFEATHARLPGRYAVKILRPELLGNREAFARFCREAEVMSELRHPNVVQIYDFNTTPEGRPYFVMEHLEGRDLEARLTQSGPMPLPAAVRVVDAVASALATAHSHGIVHRDLKPANIFLVAIDGQIDELVKVLDFGISKIRSAGTLLSSPTDMIGSPAYMSPEQARGAADEIDGRSDQFALGAITYRMLTGVEPFQGDDIASLLYQVVHEEAPRLARALPAWWDTRALQAVLDRALAKDPAQRFSGMMEMARAFEAASEQTLSHEISERGTVNLGATLIAAPPPPPLRPARTPAAAAETREGDRADAEPLEIEDSAPPIRTPTPEPIRAVTPPIPATRRARPGSDFEVDEGATLPNGSLPRSAARKESFQEPFDEEPYMREQLPVTHHRVALAALAILAIVGILAVTGIYRQLFSGARQALGLARTAPPQTEPPAPATAVPPVEGPSVSAPAGAAPEAAKPAPASERPAETPAPPERPKPTQTAKPASAEAHQAAPPLHSHRHHMEPEPRVIKRPGSVYLAPAPGRSGNSDDQFNPFVQSPGAPPAGAGPPATAPPPSARPNPFMQPPSAPSTSAPEPLQNQFSIPPPAPTEDSPSRDLVPAPEPEPEPNPGPAITPAPRTSPPAGQPAPAPPRARGPADQPMAPSF